MLNKPEASVVSLVVPFLWVGKAVEKGASGYLHAYSTWAYTKAAMDHWAQLIRQRLDAAHGK